MPPVVRAVPGGGSGSVSRSLPLQSVLPRALHSDASPRPNTPRCAKPGSLARYPRGIAGQGGSILSNNCNRQYLPEALFDRRSRKVEGLNRKERQVMPTSSTGVFLPDLRDALIHYVS
jgi:hypothetical protein